MLARLFTAKTFFGLCALFIFYATTIPWDIAHAPSFEKVSWIPGWDSERGRIWSIPDMVQNVVLFMPYGFFGFLAIDALKKRGLILGALLTGLMGLALSLLVESLQTMSATRSPSATDLATNFGGALIGGGIAAIFDKHLKARVMVVLDRTMAQRPGMLIWAAYLVAISAGSLAPFIPTLDIGMLRANVRQFLDNLWGVKPVGALLTDGLLFGALALLTARELPAFLASRRWLFKEPVSAPVGAAFAIVLTAGLAVALECGQMIIIGHSPGVQDAVVGVIASVIGGVIAMVLFKDGLRSATQLGGLSRQVPPLVLAFAVLAPTTRALQPFQFQSMSEAMDSIVVWNFVPFWALFRNINLSTFRNVFEAAAIYLPLGYALFAIGKSPKMGFLICFGLAELLELLQIPVRGRTFDITEGLYAGLMGLFAAWLFMQLEARKDAPSEGGPERPRPTLPPDDATIPMSSPPIPGGRR